MRGPGLLPKHRWAVSWVRRHLHAGRDPESTGGRSTGFRIFERLSAIHRQHPAATKSIAAGLLLAGRLVCRSQAGQGRRLPAHRRDRVRGRLRPGPASRARSADGAGGGMGRGHCRHAGRAHPVLLSDPVGCAVHGSPRRLSGGRVWLAAAGRPVDLACRWARGVGPAWPRPLSPVGRAGIVHVARAWCGSLCRAGAAPCRSAIGADPQAGRPGGRRRRCDRPALAVVPARPVQQHRGIPVSRRFHRRLSRPDLRLDPVPGLGVRRGRPSLRGRGGRRRSSELAGCCWRQSPRCSQPSLRSSW